jgi:hypothetical protein
MRFEPSGLTSDADIRTAKSIVDYIFHWFGKKFLTVDQQEELGILSPEVRARLANGYANGGSLPAAPASSEARAGRPGGPDRALQRVGGRGRVRQVRRPHDPHRLLLHVPRLRHEHWLQLVRASPRDRGSHRFAGRRMSAPPQLEDLRNENSRGDHRFWAQDTGMGQRSGMTPEP